MRKNITRIIISTTSGTYLRYQRNLITSQQDPLQTLLMFHFVGWGFCVENSYSTLYLKLSRPTSIDHVGIQALKISMHHSMYISTLHCVCCALTASQIFRRDFYGGYELVNRRHLWIFAHFGTSSFGPWF